MTATDPKQPVILNDELLRISMYIGEPNQKSGQGRAWLAIPILLFAFSGEAVTQEEGWIDQEGRGVAETESQKSKSGFSGMLLVTPDQDWEEKWATPPESTPEFSTTSTVRIGEQITILIFLANPLRDENGQANVVCDVRVTRPDGSISADAKGMECFRLVVPDDHIRNVQLAAPSIRWIGEPGDPPGEWVAQVLLTDLNRGVTLDLKTSFTLEIDGFESR